MDLTPAMTHRDDMAARFEHQLRLDAWEKRWEAYYCESLISATLTGPASRSIAQEDFLRTEGRRHGGLADISVITVRLYATSVTFKTPFSTSSETHVQYAGEHDGAPRPSKQTRRGDIRPSSPSRRHRGSQGSTRQSQSRSRGESLARMGT